LLSQREQNVLKKGDLSPDAESEGSYLKQTKENASEDTVATRGNAVKSTEREY